ncbi:MAG: TlpA family protein disulfide reductase [Gammaproteobacteria bacterium]|nr:TlpA family protein disulfide reductase [Gammaproteobacteria bacterium]
MTLFFVQGLLMKHLLLLLSLIFAMPSFSNSTHITTLEGQALYGKDLKGKWLIIHYWASWCDICMGEMPEVQKFYQHLSKSKAKMFLVNFDGLNAKQQKDLLNQQHVNIPSLKGNPAQLFGISQVSALPMTLVVTPEGKVKDVIYGPHADGKINQLMK